VVKGERLQVKRQKRLVGTAKEPITNIIIRYKGILYLARQRVRCKSVDRLFLRRQEGLGECGGSGRNDGLKWKIRGKSFKSGGGYLGEVTSDRCGGHTLYAVSIHKIGKEDVPP
jgi:hypothetical protein